MTTPRDRVAGLLNRTLEVDRQIRDVTRHDYRPAVDRLFANPAIDDRNPWGSVRGDGDPHGDECFAPHDIDRIAPVCGTSRGDRAVPVWTSPRGNTVTFHSSWGAGDRPARWRDQLGLPNRVPFDGYMFTEEWAAPPVYDPAAREHGPEHVPELAPLAAALAPGEVPLVGGPHDGRCVPTEPIGGEIRLVRLPEPVVYVPDEEINPVAPALPVVHDVYRADPRARRYVFVRTET